MEPQDGDLAPIELEPAFDTGSDAWWRAQDEAPDEAQLFSAAYDAPLPAPVAPRAPVDEPLPSAVDAPPAAAPEPTPEALPPSLAVEPLPEPAALEPAVPEPPTPAALPEPAALEPAVPGPPTPAAWPEPAVAPEPPVRAGLAELVAAREALGAKLRDARRPLERPVLPEAAAVPPPAAGPEPAPAADQPLPATTFADLVADPAPMLDQTTDELDLGRAAPRRDGQWPVEPPAPAADAAAWWLGEAAPDVVPAAASPGRWSRRRGERPRRLATTAPVRAVSGALVALAGVLLLVGALLLVTQDEQPAGPVVAAPHNVLTDGPAPTAAAVQPTAAAQPSTAAAAPPATAPSADAPAPHVRPALTVLNNSTITGLAARAASRFSAAGWTIRETGNFRGRVDATTVYYAPGQEAAARALAEAFPQVQRVRPRFATLPGEGLTVVLTRDYRS